MQRSPSTVAKAKNGKNKSSPSHSFLTREWDDKYGAFLIKSGGGGGANCSDDDSEECAHLSAVAAAAAAAAAAANGRTFRS